MTFDVSYLAQCFFRAGYRAWRHTRAPDYKSISAKVEADEVKGALQEADQITKDHGGFDKGVQQARARLESRELDVKLKEGEVVNLVRGLEPYFRNSSDKHLWGWWRAGINTAALELLHDDEQATGTEGDKSSAQKAIQNTREALMTSLGVAGLPESDLKHVGGLAVTGLNGWITAWIKGNHPPPGNPDLLRLKAQHAADRFPEEDLLRRLGCGEKGIEVLRIFYAHRPRPLSYATVGGRLFVSANAIAQHYRDLPGLVKNMLLVDVGRKRQKAWRSLTD